MPKPYAKAFYNSAAWQKLSSLIRTSRFHICELCGTPGAYEVHHIVPITSDNVNNPLVTLNQENLVLLCHGCHNAIHGRYQKAGRTVIFDAMGKPTGTQDIKGNTLTPVQLAAYREKEQRAKLSVHSPSPQGFR